MVINKKKSKTTKKKKVKKSSNASSAKRIKKHQGKELKVRKSIEVKDKVKKMCDAFPLYPELVEEMEKYL